MPPPVNVKPLQSSEKVEDVHITLLRDPTNFEDKCRFRDNYHNWTYCLLDLPLYEGFRVITGIATRDCRICSCVYCNATRVCISCSRMSGYIIDVVSRLLEASASPSHDVGELCYCLEIVPWLIERHPTTMEISYLSFSLLNIITCIHCDRILPFTYLNMSCQSYRWTMCDINYVA